MREGGIAKFLPGMRTNGEPVRWIQMFSLEGVDVDDGLLPEICGVVEAMPGVVACGSSISPLGLILADIPHLGDLAGDPTALASGFKESFKSAWSCFDDDPNM